MNLPAEFAEWELRLEQRLCCESAERHDDAGLEKRQLPDEVRTARLDLFRLRITISRRAMLQDIANEYIFPAQVNGREDFGQKLSRLSYERPARGVFVGTGRLADAYQVCVRVPFTGHAVRCRLIERTPGAVVHFARKRLERLESGNPRVPASEGAGGDLDTGRNLVQGNDR